MATPAFHRLLVTPLTPWGPLRDPLGTPWGPLGTPWRPLGDPLGTPWDPQAPPGDPLAGPWGLLGDHLGRQEPSKSAPRVAQERPRASKRVQQAPKHLAKRPQRGSQGLPKGSRSTKIPFQSAAYVEPLTAYIFSLAKTKF